MIERIMLIIDQQVLESCLYNQLYTIKYFLLSNVDFERVSVISIVLSGSKKWKQCLDQVLVFDVLLTDLSKAFDCLFD